MRYRSRRSGLLHALDGISLDMAPGEFVSLVGPSGCGKTTLLKLMAGLQGGFEGGITLAGQPVTRPSAEVGMVFQEPTLLPWRTVLQNILLPVELARQDPRAHTGARWR
jgi:NitT/TauT family transport system ATP-binding protein